MNDQAEEKDEQEKFTAWDFFAQMIHEGFVGTIPIDLLEKFPGHWFQITGVATYIIVFGCYFGFFITSYMDGLHQTFISLDRNAGICHTVGKPLTGTYLASSTGAWEGNATFKYTEAAYQFSFNNLQVDQNGFESLIAQQFELDSVGQYAANHDIATNLLVWMNYQKTTVKGEGNVQRMKFLARPSGVFKRGTSSAGVYAGPLVTGGAELSCSSQYTSFDTNSAIMSITLPTTGDCTEFGALFEGVAHLDGDVIRMQMAMNPFSTVAAINRNITTVDQLETLYIATSFVIQGQVLNVTALYDPAFEDSDTFYCVDLRGVTTADKMRDMCCIDAGGTLLLPFLAHIDEHCASCDGEYDADTCNYLGLLPFYILIPSLAGDYPAQTAAFIDIFTNATNTELKVAASRMIAGDAELFDRLCPKCAFMYIYTGDDGDSISPYKRPLSQGLHCVDSLSSEHFASLAQVPPTVLVEKYYVCRSTTYANVINAVGLSFGNTSIFAVCFLAFFLPGLYYLTKTVIDQQESSRKHDIAKISVRSSARIYSTGDLSLRKLKRIDAVCQQKVNYVESGKVDDATILYFDSCFDQEAKAAAAGAAVDFRLLEQCEDENV